jgi:hypothetical protein
MAHICLLYMPQDQAFARHLAVQLDQRGLVVWPVPDPAITDITVQHDPCQALDEATHCLIVVSSKSADSDDLRHECKELAALKKRTIVVVCDACEIPESLSDYPHVDFQGQFLLAVEDLVKLLTKTNAPTRPLTVEHPPPVVKVGLLPIALPSERCWRDDRLRINYNLPIIMTDEDLAVRVPSFLAATGFELTRSTSKVIRARRTRRFALFDPRRAEHSLSIKRRKGRLRVYYQMTRMQVYHWFPAHYRVLDREAAALYRYFAMEDLGEALIPVDKQGLRARAVSWGSLIAFLLVMAILIYLIGM